MRLSLVHNDPLLQGPKLYKQYCASCHNYETKDAFDPALADLVNPSPTAPNLYRVGSRNWIAGMLDPERITSPDYFGYVGSPFVGDGDYTDMTDFILECFGEDLEPEQKEAIVEAMMKIAAALSAEARLSYQSEMDNKDAALIAEGRELIEGGLAELVETGMSCTDCHSYGSMEDIGSPVLDGYMSREWMVDFIRNPSDDRFYGDINDRMPAFAPHENSRLNQLDDKSLELIVDWLRGDYYRSEAEIHDR